MVLDNRAATLPPKLIEAIRDALIAGRSAGTVVS